MTADGDRDETTADGDDPADGLAAPHGDSPTDESDRPVALVTGAAGGIGRAVTRVFCAAGWRVYATDVSTADLDGLADDVAPDHGDDPADGHDTGIAGLHGDNPTENRLETAVLDVTDEADRSRVLDRIERESGRLDCLVNNAGFAVPGAVVDADGDPVRELYDVLVH
ncbi:MAG: SDR family NAD(P)-dependent oxidoreductase, partial [Halobaculum sp.]